MKNDKRITLEIVERWLKDDDWRVRTAATKACTDKDVPLEIIECWLKSDNCYVRDAAMNTCKEKGIAIPIIRTFEPPAVVYKKCIGGVIVCATIPADAQVRGAVGRKCRSNKAVITKIIGDLNGEKVGISIRDKATAYYEGDEIIVEDFDMGDEECSTGFHFFCSREEAEDFSI